MDGTLIQAWASHKSFVRKDDSDNDIDGPGDKRAGDATDTTDNNNTGAGFKGQTCSNDTHESSTDADADARLYCKGDNASRLRFMGHTLSDNRHGLIANAVVTAADG